MSLISLINNRLQEINVWGIFRRTIIFSLTTIVSFFGVKPVDSEPVSLATVAAGLSIAALISDMFVSGADPTSTAVLHTRQLANRIHLRLNKHDTLLTALLDGQDEIIKQFRVDLSRELARENLIEIKAAMLAISEIGNNDVVFFKLYDAVNRMMERNDLYLLDYVGGMLMILHLLFENGMEDGTNMSGLDLDIVLSRYIERLDKVFDHSRQESLVNTIRKFREKLCDSGNKYFQAELSIEDIRSFAGQIQFFEVMVYLAEYTAYLISQFRYGRLSSNPTPHLIHSIPEIGMIDVDADTWNPRDIVLKNDIDILVHRYLSLYYVSHSVRYERNCHFVWGGPVHSPY